MWVMNETIFNLAICYKEEEEINIKAKNIDEAINIAKEKADKDWRDFEIVDLTDLKIYE